MLISSSICPLVYYSYLSTHQSTSHTSMVLHPCTPPGIRKHLCRTSVELSVPSEWTLDPTSDNHLICLIWLLGCELLESTAGVLFFSKYFRSPLNIIIGKMLSFLDQSVVDRIVSFLLLFISLPSSWPISVANQPEKTNIIEISWTWEGDIGYHFFIWKDCQGLRS